MVYPEIEQVNYNRDAHFSTKLAKQTPDIQNEAKLKILNSLKGQREISANRSLQEIVEMLKAREQKPSATGLTGVGKRDNDLMHNFKQFDVESRVNRFKAEDFYFVRNQLALKKDVNVAPVKADTREVIHVMIDYQSLQSLGKMDETQVSGQFGNL